MRALANWAALVCLVTATNIAQAGVAYPDPGWDFTYDGVADSFGTSLDTLTLDGNWRRDQANRWDGSAPGEFGDPVLDPNSDSPGGIQSLTEGNTTYLRIQDTGNPMQIQPNGPSAAWNDPSNRRFLFGHDIKNEHPTATNVMTDGVTISFRARLASTGVLDPIYPDFNDGEPEFPNLREITPWPTGGKGYNVTDSAKGMFTVSENGMHGIGFSLALDADTPGGDDGIENGTVIPAIYGGDGINVGGGLIMNNQPGGGVLGLPGTDRALQASANVLPISDAELLDWHEFWITIEDRDGNGDYEVDVYRDGGLTATSFVAMSSNGVEFTGADAQFISFGLPSQTSWGAVDIDFFSYKLGVVTPELSVRLGDVNRDQLVNGLDVGPFVALVLGGLYQVEADLNEDQAVNGLDVDPFVTAVIAGGAATVPEPSTVLLSMVALAGLGLLGRLRWQRR